LLVVALAHVLRKLGGSLGEELLVVAHDGLEFGFVGWSRLFRKIALILFWDRFAARSDSRSALSGIESIRSNRAASKSDANGWACSEGGWDGDRWEVACAKVSNSEPRRSSVLCCAS